MKDFLERCKEKLIKNRYFLLAFCLIWIFTIVFSLNHYKTTLGMESIGNESFEHVTELSNNKNIKQTLETIEGAESFSVKFATYARKNVGEVHITLTGMDSGIKYADETIKVSDIDDNSYFTIGLSEKLDPKKDKSIIAEITSNSTTKKGVGVYYSESDNIENSVLYINDLSMNSDLTCKLLRQNEYYKKFSDGVITWSIIGLSLLILMIALEPKEEIFFACAVFVIGLIFMAVMTPMSVPDEQFHYESAYQISSKILGEDHTIMDVAYRNYSHFGGHENVSSAYWRFIDQFNEPLEMKEKYEVVTNDIDDLQYIVYFFPQTVGVLLGRVLKLNFLKTFYFGRFTNLLFFVGCVFFAIRKAPIHKTLFGILCCMPMFIQQCSSYSYDTFVTGLSLIVVAYFLKWYHVDEQISLKEAIVVFVAMLCLAPAKIVYGLFVLPFFFISKERFGSTKRKILILLAISIPTIYILASTLIPQISRLFNRIEETYGDTAGAEPQIKTAGLALRHKPLNLDTEIPEEEMEHRLFSIGFIVEYPIYTLKLVLRTVRYSIKKWFYDSLGRTLSGVSMVLPLSLTHLLALSALMAAFVKEDYAPGLIVRIVIVGMCVIIAGLILLGFLLSWTHRDETMIMGVQGRYFSPLLPYFFTIFNNKYVSLPKVFNKVLTFGQLLMIFETMLFVLSFTFVN